MNEETTIALLAWRKWFKERCDRVFYEDTCESIGEEERALFGATHWIEEQRDE